MSRLQEAMGVSGGNAAFRFCRKGQIEYVEAPSFAACDFVLHAFTTRRGGLSRAPYAGLNCGELTGDETAAVRGNLSLVEEAFALPAGRLVLMGQVHGDRIRILEGKAPQGLLPACDGMVTALPGVPLAVKTADCVPLFFLDPVRRVIGVAHAGWRGTALAIAQKMVEVLERDFSCHLEDILVAIGPAIGGCCYEVDEPVRQALAKWNEVQEVFLPAAGEGRWRLDLALANRLQIASCGVPEGNISTAGLCTACRPDLFFSHRRAGGRTGRMINLLMMKG